MTFKQHKQYLIATEVSFKSEIPLENIFIIFSQTYPECKVIIWLSFPHLAALDVGEMLTL